MGWSGLRLEYRNVPELLENSKIRIFTAQRSLGLINGEALGAEDGRSDVALTGEVEGTRRLMADSEDISLGKSREWW